MGTGQNDASPPGDGRERIADGFEMLLGVEGRDKRVQIAERLTGLFASHPATPTTRKSHKGNDVPCTRLEGWVFEFYATRFREAMVAAPERHQQRD